MPSPPRPASNPDDAFAALPDPAGADTLDDLIDRLRLLKTWAGDPSYETITKRVNAAWTRQGRPVGGLPGKTTVVDCFRAGRRRINTDLVIAVVQALHPDVGYVSQWRQALQVVGGKAQAAGQVRVQDELPADLAAFTGRTRELEQLRVALDPARRATATGEDLGMVCVIAGMAGVGKSHLAIHAAHRLMQARLSAREPLDRVLFVNLRGFDPDPAQPPADPAGVLEGFLRLLGVSGHQLPHDLNARTAAYRTRLTGTRTLLVLDNAAGTDQVRPLLPQEQGCPVLVTSRHALPGLDAALNLGLDVFTRDEADYYLGRATLGVPVGDDPTAAARIADRCGYLPLALGLVAAHIAAASGWTLTDHADRLDERHRERRLESGVELALDLSYRRLPADRQQLLRLAALHPGQDLDIYAAAALTGTDLPGIREQLDQLCRDHLLQQGTPGRYLFHDLVRAYAVSRSTDEDAPPARRAALTRLFDYYLAATGAAMNTLYPAENHRRPAMAQPGKPIPDLTDPDAAVAWLDTERATLTAVAARTASDGWPTHTTRLSSTLFRYLAGGYHGDAVTVHGHALLAAQHTDDRSGQAHALNNLGLAQLGLGQYEAAAEHFHQALTLFQQNGDQIGQTRALSSLGDVEERVGRYGSATGHYEQALTLCRAARDPFGEARALGNLGGVEARLGRYGPSADHLEGALTMFRQAGDVDGEAAALDILGTLHTLRGQPARARDHHQWALTIFRRTGQRAGQAAALNGLGEAAHACGHPAKAIAHHTKALAVAADISDIDQQARAHTGLGHAHHALNQAALARRHYQHAMTLYTDLGTPDADRIRNHLTDLDGMV
jgi:tetratricopeptide (TPR) repeat protein